MKGTDRANSSLCFTQAFEKPILAIEGQLKTAEETSFRLSYHKYHSACVELLSGEKFATLPVLSTECF